MLQGGEEDDLVSIGDRSIWISREFSKALTCSSYIIYCLLFVNWNQSGSVVTRYAYNLKDLGSSPRSGKNLNAIFQYEIPCYANIQVHHSPSIINMPRPLGGQSKGWKLKNTYAWSNASYTIQKVNEFQIKWARITRPTPPELGTTPPWFALLFLFLFFL